MRPGRDHLVAIIASAALLALACLLVLPRVATRTTPESPASAPRESPATRVGMEEPGTRTHRSRHYEVVSSAGDADTTRVADAAEALHEAYLAFFGAAAPTTTSLHRLRLYGSREEFRRHNRSRPWAEAYYLAPICHAYVERSAQNPYHWMVHEATHQLNDSIIDLRRPRWINEGLASYFGASRLADGKLLAGDLDIHAYPTWWLHRTPFSGDLATDIEQGRVIPLHDLIAGSADIDSTVNQHYIGFLSLTHFLVHHDHGKYLPRYLALVENKGDLDDFEHLIGPLPEIERAWYAHLLALAAEARAQAGTQ